tara:strand:- start:693 stop:1808 length:1116 start_codon:yes stop_codon:yes gene_type:complete
MELVLTIIPFLILLTVVVFVHEYGHYYYARKYGVGVTDFSIGFGKEIFGWNDKFGTRWKVCWIPLGGYVKFFGDRNVFSQNEQKKIIDKYSEKEKNKLFILKPLYQRAIIVAAGPIANFILAFFIFSFIYMFSGKDFTPAIISEVQKNTPAHSAGMKVNDRIIFVDGKKINSILEIPAIINTTTADTIEFIILRDDNEVVLSITPIYIDSMDNLGNKIRKKIIGVKLGSLDNEINKVKLGPAKAIYFSIKEVYFISVATLNYIYSIIFGSGDSSQLGGPIRIAKITGQVAELGFIPFLGIMSYISISLGLINLFPIPLLDGGHLMFYFCEYVKGSPLNQKTQENFFRIGMFLLIFIMFFATFNDLKDLGLF